MVEMYKGFCKDYPVISIEDPFDQDDSAHTTKFTAEGVCQARPCERCAALAPSPDISMFVPRSSPRLWDAPCMKGLHRYLLGD